MACSAIGCNNVRWKHKSISFHKFPPVTDSRYIIWCRKVRRKTGNGGLWQPTSKHGVLCSKHFTPDQFLPVFDGATLRRLRPDAIPTIFNFGQIYQAQNESQTRVSMEATQTPQLPKKIKWPPLRLAKNVRETFETETYHDHPYHPKRSDLCKRICNLEEEIDNLKKKVKKIHKQNFMKGRKISSLISSLIDEKKLRLSTQKELKAYESTK